MNDHVSISQVKRDISELVNRVRYTGERIIITSQGKPKVALISLEDYECLLNSESRATNIKKWLADVRSLSYKIEKRRGGPVDVDVLLDGARKDLEE